MVIVFLITCSFLYGSWLLGFIGDRPHKPTKLSGNGGYNDLFGFAFGPQVPVARTKPQLGLPNNVANVLRQIFLPLEQCPTDPGPVPIGPGRFDQCATHMPVACFGNRTAPGLFASRICPVSRCTRAVHSLRVSMYSCKAICWARWGILISDSQRM